MIIDLILDRKDNEQFNCFGYDPKAFYNDCMEYDSIFGVGSKITMAMDYGDEKDVQKALCDYIDDNGYNPDIKNFINTHQWLKEDRQPIAICDCCGVIIFEGDTYTTIDGQDYCDYCGGDNGLAISEIE